MSAATRRRESVIPFILVRHDSTTRSAASSSRFEKRSSLLSKCRYRMGGVMPAASASAAVVVPR